MNFRRFEPQDAAFCFKVHSNAFIQKFSGELTPVEVSAGVNSYMPDDYIRMSEEMPFSSQKNIPFVIYTAFHNNVLNYGIGA